MCSFENVSSHRCLKWSWFVYVRLPLWRHRACIATYSPGKAALTGSWWYGFNCGWITIKITRLDCYDQNDRGRMEIDHAFAPGAVVGRATTHSWGRAEQRVTPLLRGGASNHGSWRKNVVNSYNPLFRRRSKKTSKLRVIGLCAGNSPHKWPVTRKKFPFDDVIMKMASLYWTAWIWYEYDNNKAKHVQTVCMSYGIYCQHSLIGPWKIRMKF